MDPTDDPQVMSLARAAQGGDSEAFSALITALHLPVRRFLAARAISTDQVEELLQDTFVAAWQGLPQWRAEGSPRSWVVGIAANLLRADVRRRMKTQGVGPDLMDALLLKAATYAATWPNDLILSFNLSANSIASPAASQNIINIINAAGLAPHRLDVEVTESAFLLDVAAARASINALRRAGVKVSLDDFGTGYSSFSQLCDLPLDTLKIDKSFIDRICTDPNAANVVRAIIGMCDNLDLKCLAEGIEHNNQLELLEQLGCHAGQGYIISKPLNVTDVDTMLRAMQQDLDAGQKRVA